MNRTWWLVQGDTRVGELQQYAIDQPTFLCHFIPGPGWEGVRALFESWEDLHGPDPDGSRTAQVIKPIVDLGLTLITEDEGRHLALYTAAHTRPDGRLGRAEGDGLHLDQVAAFCALPPDQVGKHAELLVAADWLTEADTAGDRLRGQLTEGILPLGGLL